MGGGQFRPPPIFGFDAKLFSRYKIPFALSNRLTFARSDRSSR